MAALGWPLKTTLLAPKAYSLFNGANDYGDDLSTRYGWDLYGRESRGGPAQEMYFRPVLQDINGYLFDLFIVNDVTQLKDVK
ncbi:hypothetical protein [Sphaerisporangium dianthi]|uniref:Uncharacterized protein n=1 Tax=Sphaerisporangium dianthi TaxID=1436120 RepID=A0ABV9CFE3_9ACTN